MDFFKLLSKAIYKFKKSSYLLAAALLKPPLLRLLLYGARTDLAREESQYVGVYGHRRQTTGCL
jgi:hypothetical protein